MRSIGILLLVSVLFSSMLTAQADQRSNQLFEQVSVYRSWWDLKQYNLELTIDPENHFIAGSNKITFTAIDTQNLLQLDLQQPMRIDSITDINGAALRFEKQEISYLIEIPKLTKGSVGELIVYFSGNPKTAQNAPWDGGVVWSSDQNGTPLIATANQGIGSSIWWPNKDHAYDEPENGATVTLNVPKGLIGVSNGRLTLFNQSEHSNTFVWEVKNPINNYAISFNIAAYAYFNSSYKGLSGTLDLDYYVLPENLGKAQEQFKQVLLLLEAFEYWFGPYPFYEDGFKLIEVPYLGMEHQSAVTYGNEYRNGYRGTDLSGTGHGLLFDFIIIHEAGHEWFANSLTANDNAHLWLQEGFTAYSESLYLEYHYSKKEAFEYIIGTRKRIENKQPMVGPEGVRYDPPGDIYYKGANVLHTLRMLVDDDTKWRSLLTAIQKEFYHSVVSSEAVERFIAKELNLDLTLFFEQYLRQLALPKLELQQEGKQLRFKFEDVVDRFEMPVRLFIGKEPMWIRPTTEWKTISIERNKSVEVDQNFLVNTTLSYKFQ